MEASPSTSRTWMWKRTHMSQEKFVKKVIAPAIEGKTCSICLGEVVDRKAAVITVCLHAYCFQCIRKWSDVRRKCPLCNAPFDSLFYRISLSYRTFIKEKLSPIAEPATVTVDSAASSNRFIRRNWDQSNRNSRRTRPLPRRHFGRPGSVPSNVVAERILQWRASRYTRRMQAVPFYSRSRLEQFQNISGNSHAKEEILQRIEPWIKRELQAVLDDPDPTIIVHVVTSTFIARLEESNNSNPLEFLSGEDDFLAPLRRFLNEQTNAFWHELCCFAESQYNMETYDAVVRYEPLG